MAESEVRRHEGEASRAGRDAGPLGEERRALLAAARAGDTAAFERLFTPDLDLAWRMALRVSGEPAAADDALQEGLVAAYRALDRVEPRNLRGWFVRIVENAARDAARRERRRPTVPLPDGGSSDQSDGGARVERAREPIAGRSSDPADRAEQGELAAQLRTALSAIPAERRTAIILYDVDGYDYAEIAALVGASIGTVKSRISRGRAELRSLLSDVHGNRASRGDVTEG